MLAPVPGGAHFGPAAVDAGHAGAPCEAAPHAAASVGCGVGFHPAGAAGFPRAGAQGHLPAHFVPGIGPANGGFGHDGGQDAVDLAGALAAGHATGRSHPVYSRADPSGVHIRGRSHPAAFRPPVSPFA